MKLRMFFGPDAFFYGKYWFASLPKLPYKKFWAGLSSLLQSFLRESFYVRETYFAATAFKSPWFYAH